MNKPMPAATTAATPWPPRRLWLATAAGALLAGCLAGCATWSPGSPLKAHVVGLTALPGEGIELRFMVKLRLQNASDADIAFDGAALELDLRGMSFASGVSPQQGKVPRFGELVLEVPVSIPPVALLRQALSLSRESNAPRLRIAYAARGRLGGGLLGGQRFESTGELDWPPAPQRDARIPDQAGFV